MKLILLTSAKQDVQATRSFSEFETTDDLAHTIISYYEDYLQSVRGDESEGKIGLEYTSDDLFNFMDKYFDEIVCLERQDGHHDLWIPYSTSWIKEAIYLSLRKEYENQADEPVVMETENHMVS